MEKAWFYEILFFQVAIAMVKDKKKMHYKRYNVIKISFIHYRNYITWTRVNIPVVFEEFDLVYVFWLLVSCNYHRQLVKGQLQLKSGGAAASPSQPPGLYGPVRNTCRPMFLDKIDIKAQS